jgi:hypothetical protein
VRIDSIDLIRFGHFANREIEFPLQNPDYHLVYGDNEAGNARKGYGDRVKIHSYDMAGNIHEYLVDGDGLFLGGTNILPHSMEEKRT